MNSVSIENAAREKLTNEMINPNTEVAENPDKSRRMIPYGVYRIIKLGIEKLYENGIIFG